MQLGSNLGAACHLQSRSISNSRHQLPQLLRATHSRAQRVGAPPTSSAASCSSACWRARAAPGLPPTCGRGKLDQRGKWRIFWECFQAICQTKTRRTASFRRQQARQRAGARQFIGAPKSLIVNWSNRQQTITCPCRATRAPGAPAKANAARLRTRSSGAEVGAAKRLDSERGERQDREARALHAQQV